MSDKNYKMRNKPVIGGRFDQNTIKNPIKPPKYTIQL